MGLTEVLQKRVFCFVKDPKKFVTIAWLISLVLVIIVFIVACNAASKLKNVNGGTAASFAAMWTAILLIIVSIIQTMVMRRYPTPLAVGGLLGVIFVMTQQMLILFVFFADYANNATSAIVKAAEQAMAAFAFFLFLVYGIFGTMLAVYRDDIIKPQALQEGDVSQDAPPQSV